MPLASLELINARETAGRLLEELGLEAYLFEVEPGDPVWKVRLECAGEEGWSSLTFESEKEALLAASADEAAYQRLLKEWRERLAGCRSS